MTFKAANNKPLVSIVMAAYNEEKYIKEAIESLLHQTYSEFELIIVNDGSTDQTENIILSFPDERIKYIRNEKNLKLIDSLNKGLSCSSGVYIARMDADDIAMPDRIEKQVAFMELNPDIGLSGAQLEIFGNQTGTMKYPLKHEDIKLNLFITSCFGNNVVIFRRGLLEKHQLFFPKGYLHAEDYKCWTNWVLQTKVHNLDENLVKYRSHENSVSFKHKLLQRETRNRVRQEYITRIFGLQENEQSIIDLVGNITLKKYKAIRYVLSLNKEKKIFNQQKLEEILLKIWYLDSLEKVENNFFILFKFPLIFMFGLPKNFVNWVNLFKHRFKLKFAGV